MIFDTRQRLALAIIREVAKLIKPDVGQDECPVTAFAFALTLLQAQGLHDSLEEQLDGLFAVAVQNVGPVLVVGAPGGEDRGRLRGGQPCSPGPTRDSRS
jgi:hypothetical protein